MNALIYTSFEETLADALTSVRLVPRWTLAKPAWGAVADALQKLADAIATGDPRLVQRATERLDACYPPTRLAAIRSTHGAEGRREVPPPEVMELVNTLVHPSGGWPEEPVRAMYSRLAREYEAEPTVPDRGGGVVGDRYPL